MSAAFEVDVSGGLDAARAARRAVEANHPTLPLSVQSDISLIVTELVTNAVRHRRATDDRPLEFQSNRQDGHIRVELIDPGTGFHSLFLSQDAEAHGDWGVALVDRIAARWGMASRAAGICVWFELHVGAPP